MKKLFLNTVAASAAILALSTSASHVRAEPPKELAVADIIKLQPGEPRTYEFAGPVSRIGTSSEGVIVITPHSDRTYTIQGLALGQAMVVAHGADGEIVHRMLVEVAYAGTLVKTYGAKADKDIGYTSVLCTPIGCGRPNPDLKTKTVTEHPNGAISTTTTERVF